MVFFGEIQKRIMNPKYSHSKRILRIKSKSGFFRFVIQAFSWGGMAKSISGERFPCDITLRANSSEQRTQKSFGTARVPYLLEFHKKKENSFIVVRALQTHLEILLSKSSSLRMECILSAQLKFRFCAHFIVKNPCDLTSQICFRILAKKCSLSQLNN